MLSVTLQCYKIVFSFWRGSYSWSSHRLERRIAVEQLERREAATATGSWIAKKENAWRGNFHWSCLFPTKSLCLKVEASDKGGLTFGARLHWEWNAKVTRGAFWQVELFVRKERRRNVHNCICPARSCTHSFKTGAKQGLFWGRFDPVVVKDLALPFTRKKPERGYFLKLLWRVISAIFQIFYICGMKKWAGCDRASMEAASAFGSPVGKATIYKEGLMNCESIPVNCQNSKTQRGNKHLSESSWTN